MSASEQMDARGEQYNSTFHATRAYVREIVFPCKCHGAQAPALGDGDGMVCAVKRSGGWRSGGGGDGGGRGGEGVELFHRLRRILRGLQQHRIRVATNTDNINQILFQETEHNKHGALRATKRALHRFDKLCVRSHFGSEQDDREHIMIDPSISTT